MYTYCRVVEHGEDQIDDGCWRLLAGDRLEIQYQSDERLCAVIVNAHQHISNLLKCVGRSAASTFCRQRATFQLRFQATNAILATD